MLRYLARIKRRGLVAIPTQFQFNNWSVSYQGVYTPATSGDYNFSVAESGTEKLYVNGQLVEQRLRDDFGYVDHVTVALTAGRPVSTVLDYSPQEAGAGISATGAFANFNTFLCDEIHLGAVAPPASGATEIQHPAAAARHADVAVVFASRQVGEGHDIENLSLPGDQNEMIEAVAAANPHTVVVLTGGPVSMPWLQRVSSVSEMWERGATFGTAVSSLLFGDTDHQASSRSRSRPAPTRARARRRPKTPGSPTRRPAFGRLPAARADGL